MYGSFFRGITYGFSQEFRGLKDFLIESISSSYGNAGLYFLISLKCFTSVIYSGLNYEGSFVFKGSTNTSKSESESSVR